MNFEAARAVRIETMARDRGLRLRRHGHELVGPCPRCGGQDRFAMHTGKQVWHCRGCNIGGNVIALVMHIDGCDARAAAGTLTDGAAKNPATTGSRRPREPAAPVADNAEGVRGALRVWDEAIDLPGTIAWDYLTRPRAQGGRGLVIPPGMTGRVLRFHPRHRWRTEDGGVIQTAALLALYSDIRTNEPRAIWRRPLTPEGRSAGTPRAMGPKAGCAVMLTPSDDVTSGLHVGEGPETVLAAMRLGFGPAWALGDTGNLHSFPVLAGIDALTICVDRDANGEGQKASSACYDRWTTAGREVWSVIPDKIDSDMNDVVAGGQ
jgi:hypothetical protein